MLSKSDFYFQPESFPLSKYKLSFCEAKFIHNAADKLCHNIRSVLKLTQYCSEKR